MKPAEEGSLARAIHDLICYLRGNEEEDRARLRVALLRRAKTTRRLEKVARALSALDHRTQPISSAK